jgi:uncharacterized protein (TIRG00374 family)
MVKRHLSVVLKVAVSAALMYYVLHGIAPDWKTCGDQMAAAFRKGYGWLAVAVIAAALAFVIASLRWRTILNGHDVAISFGEAFRLFLVGFFFGQFMPGGLAAGDVVRSYYIAGRNEEKKTEVVTTVILDRVVGFYGMVTLLVVSLLLGGEYIGRFFILMAMAGVLAVGSVVLFTKGLLKKLPLADWIYQHLPYRDFLVRVYEAFRHYRKHKREMIVCWLQSVVIQFLLVVVGYCVGHSVGVEGGALYYLVRIPLVGAVAAIPISFGNIGTAEAAYLLFFLQEDRSVVLAFALTMRVLWLFIGAMGGIVWWGERARISRRLAAKEDGASGTISGEGWGA